MSPYLRLYNNNILNYNRKLHIIRSLLEKMFNWGEIEQNNSVNSTSQKVKLHPFTLSFPKFLEEDFLHTHNSNSILLINISGVAAVILFSSFLLFDYFLVPELFFQFFLLRVVLGSSIIFSAMFIINKYMHLTQPMSVTNWVNQYFFYLSRISQIKFILLYRHHPNLFLVFYIFTTSIYLGFFCRYFNFSCILIKCNLLY